MEGFGRVGEAEKKRGEQRKPAETDEDDIYEDFSMERDEEMRAPDKTMNTAKKRYTEQVKTELAHKEYLEGCYKRQIRLPLTEKQNVSIYSYTDHRVAKGYQKVVTTCQGMYFELKKDQVVWSKLPKKRMTIGGDLCWRGEGVSVYKPTSDRVTRPIVPHRFAINLTYTVPRSQLKTDRYYMHIYQTKIGPDRRTLRSREMVQEMKRRFKKLYWPRPVDTHGRRAETTAAERRTPAGAINVRRYYDQRRPAQKRTMHQTRRPQGGPQRDPQMTQGQDIMTGLKRLTAAVERLVEKGGGH